jgi:hypothetical protein
VVGVARFFCAHPGWYNSLARILLLCEIGQLLNVILQMYFLDTMLGHSFFSLGSDFMTAAYPLTHYHALEDVFPLVTKCKMYYIGATGNPVMDSGTSDLITYEHCVMVLPTTGTFQVLKM